MKFCNPAVIEIIWTWTIEIEGLAEHISKSSFGMVVKKGVGMLWRSNQFWARL